MWLVHRTPNEGDPENVEVDTSFHILFLQFMFCISNLCFHVFAVHPHCGGVLPSIYMNPRSEIDAVVAYTAKHPKLRKVECLRVHFYISLQNPEPEGKASSQLLSCSFYTTITEGLEVRQQHQQALLGG
jgi:hypothetical protein